MATNQDGLALFSAKNYGSASAICVGLEFGFEVLGSESESSQRATFYPHQVVDTEFTVMLAFRSHGSWEKFNAWMEKYGRGVSQSSKAAAMVVVIPSRRFMKVGIPSSGFMYGDKVGTIVNRSSLHFKVVTDLVKGTSSPNIGKDDTVKFFYPTGTQLNGKDRADDFLYDTAEDTSPTATDRAIENRMAGRQFY